MVTNLIVIGDRSAGPCSVYRTEVSILLAVVLDLVQLALTVTGNSPGYLLS